MPARALHPITLNAKEQKIKDILIEYAAYYNKHISDQQGKKPIELRITGGWVRDKLLGRESHDIDIGIDHLSGLDFVTGLKGYLDEKTKSECNDTSETKQNSLSGIHKIKKNPEKSKHLETCTTRLMDSDIDFVNLRSEKYTEDSRIPSIKTGTPKEDAYRRDATLNSLFFNLSTMQVEDWTGRGLEDLKNGILRTPLEPEKTFLDDPLRCLRLIRFASNFNFTIDDKTFESMKHEEIKKALDQKISRERIGTEFRKTILGSNPVYGLKLLRDVHFWTIFSFGEKEMDANKVVKSADPDKVNDEQIQRLLTTGVMEALSDIVDKLATTTEFVENHKNTYPLLSQLLTTSVDTDDRKLGLYCSLILNKWDNILVIQKDEGVPEQAKTVTAPKKKKKKSKKGKKAKPTNAAHLIILQGLRQPMRIADLTELTISHLDEFGNSASHSNEMSRSELALSLIIPYNENWKLNMLVFFLLSVFKNPSDIELISSQVEKLLQKIGQLGLQEVYKQSSLLNGRELISMTNRKPGPWLRDATEKLFIWQLDHPDCTKEQVAEYAKTAIQ